VAEDVLLATTWWSFGRDRTLLHRALDELERRDIRIHDAWSDPDLNRTLICFSGGHGATGNGLIELAHLILPSIDLRRHSGSHPRTGALDLVRFTPLSGDVSGVGALATVGERLSASMSLPIYADGPDSNVGSEARILRLREGGFGSLANRILEPDYGPPTVHERYGVTTLLAGPLQLHAALELADPTSRVADAVADTLNALRAEGDPMLVGVQSEGHAQPTREGSLLLFSFGMPDENHPDHVLRVAEKEAKLLGAGPGRARALGLWRRSDLPRATRLSLDERKQIWETGRP
jgi:hypothetical protein